MGMGNSVVNTATAATKGAKILGVLGGISTGIGIVGAVAGFFGSRRKRKQAKKKRAEARALIGTQFGALQQAAGAEQAEFAERRSMLGQAQGLQQTSAVSQYGIGMENLQNQVASTGLAGSGSGQQALMQGQQQFAQQQLGTVLQNQEQAFNLNMQEASKMRDIQSAGFQLDQYAAENWIKSAYGQSLLDSLG